MLSASTIFVGRWSVSSECLSSLQRDTARDLRTCRRCMLCAGGKSPDLTGNQQLAFYGPVGCPFDQGSLLNVRQHAFKEYRQVFE